MTVSEGPDVVLLGAGKLGAAAVERWVEGGRQVTVWNRTPERAEKLAGPQVSVETDLATAVVQAPVVVTLLSDGPALRDVLLDRGAIGAMEAGTTLMDLSTVDVASSEAVARAAAERGLGYVRGAVSGTASVLSSGAAGLLLSGPQDALGSVKALLDDLGENQVVVGEGEEAKIAKLATNMLLAGTMEVLAEAVVMAEASGLPRETVLDALGSTVLSSKFLEYKGAALKDRNYDATFTTAALLKDVNLALAQGESVGVSEPALAAIRERLDRAVEEGWGEDDFLALTRVVQTDAGRPVD